MLRGTHWLLTGAVAATLGLAGCGYSQGVLASTEDKPARVVPHEGTDRSRLFLTEATVQRLGIKIEAPRETSVALPGEAAPTRHPAIPAGAVLYLKDGSTWVYASSGALSFERQIVTVGRIDGEFAVLRNGLTPGTLVVTIGTAELLGIEYGVQGN